MEPRSHYDWDSHNRQVVVEGTQALERTGDSLARSHQIAVETETIGTEVVSELGEQREALLRTRSRLEDANSQLDNAKSVLIKMAPLASVNRLGNLSQIGLLFGEFYDEHFDKVAKRL
ncbi:hypothetical protein HUJ04_013088 [Dendroctonus ponderosae]|nr:hypothetical protein HUJ04_013088 [Dendroctonus ponderosae]